MTKRVLSDANSDGQGIQHGCEMGGGLFSSEAVSNRTYRRKNVCTVCSKNMFDFVPGKTLLKSNTQ